MQRTAALLLGFLSLLVSPFIQAPALCQPPDPKLTPETAAERKAAVLSQFQKLEEANLSEGDFEKARGELSRLVAALTAFEEAVQRRSVYKAQVENMPRRLQEVVASHKQLEERPTPNFPDVTGSLRAEYEAQRQALEAELNDLTAQGTSGGVRLARLPDEIQALNTSLERLVLQQQDSGRGTPQEGAWVAQAELLAVQIQAHRTSVEALEAERLWLINRGSLHDALIRVARLRLKHVQDDLRVIQTSLGATAQKQQETLGERVAQIQQALTDSVSPATRIPLQIRLETAVAQQRTADYQRQLASLQAGVNHQETLNNQVRQDTGRLVSLAEQYAGGERIAQRLLIKFEHLRRQRGRLRDKLGGTLRSRFQVLLPGEKSANPLDVLIIRLRTLNETLFAVDDQLYEFDDVAKEQVNQLTAALFSASPNELLGALSRLRRDLEAQRGALRVQQQALADLTQTTSRLIALRREHNRLLDEGYRLALSKMLWLKNGAALNLRLVGEVPTHALSFISRSAAAVRADLPRLWLHLKQGAGLWGLLVLLFAVLPAVLIYVRSGLNRATHASLAVSLHQEEPPRIRAVLMLALQAAMWPLYLALLGWSRQLFILQPDAAGMTAALISGIYLVAVVLGISLFSQALFRPGGWGQQFWGLEDAGNLFLRRAFAMGCMAAFLLLVPRQVVLAASQDAFLGDGRQILERLLLLAFQGVLFVLTLRISWSTSPLMTQVLARSRGKDGFLWRVWPFIQAVLLMALAGVMTLDILGYRYTARFIWLNGLETLSIAFASRLVLLFLLMYGARRFVGALYDPGGRWHVPSGQQAAERSLAVFRFVSQLVLSVIALLLILELWGVSVWTLVSSQAGPQIMTRAFIVLMTVGVVLMVIQGSNVLAEYILRPRLTAQGETREIGRKLRTLTPLVQTILKFVVLFIAVLVLLEQVNIRTGPLLAGLGLFGLAVGLASQSLIKDVINGLFILFEDSISVGDIATLRGVSGVIEKITLRAVVLRDLRGDVHVIPNSTIDLVTNKSKVFSRYLVDVGVAYREDADTVMDVLREVDTDMRQDLRYGYNMLEPIEMWGLDRFEDSAVYIQARLKTRPGKQWEVGREFNRRMKKIFDARGIEIPFPHRTLYWGMPKEGSQSPIRLSVDNPDGETPTPDTL